MILFNFSTNPSGGGKYHAQKFLNHIFKSIDKKKCIVVLNEKHDISLEDIKFFKIKSPSISIKSRKILKDIVKNNNVKLVYTMAGPTFIKFDCVHIMGLSNAWLLKENIKLLLENYSGFFNKSKVFFKVLYQMRGIKHSDLFLFQTEESKMNFVKNYEIISDQNSNVVPNAVIDKNDLICSTKTKKFSKNKTNILIPSSFYKHKGIDEVFWIIENLKNLNLNFYFTIPDDDFKRISTKKYNNVYNLGSYSPFEESSMIENSDIILLPSKMETCSATFLEASLTTKIIIVRDKTFSREVFGNNVNYFNDKKELLYMLKNIKNLKSNKPKLNVFSYEARTIFISKIINEFYKDKPITS